MQPFYIASHLSHATVTLGNCPRVKTVSGLLMAVIVLTFLFGAISVANATDEPISIEADQMVSLENDNTVVFIGKVIARQGKLTIRSEEMTAHYVKSEDDSDRTISQVEKLICKKNVEVVQGDWTGVGDRMDYFAAERKVVLSGNAKATQGLNMVSGKVITYYLDEKRSTVEQDKNAPGRVKALVFPKSSDKP